MGRGVRIEERAGSVRVRKEPPSWPSSSARDQRLDAAALEGVGELAGRHKADSLLVIRNGRVVLERYWNRKTPTDVQQTYSGTKSAFSLLLGVDEDAVPLEGCPVLFPLRRIEVAFGGRPLQDFLLRSAA